MLRIISGALCLSLAAASLGAGVLLTNDLIREYGATVNPLRLAGQAAVLWGPPTVLLLLAAWGCLRTRREPTDRPR